MSNAFRLVRTPLLAWALAALAAAILGVMLLGARSVSAQAASDAAVQAAQADLGTQLGIDGSTATAARVEGVTWSDGCMGAGAADEACLQALVPGYVIWLAVDGDAYRYHTNEDGSAVRLSAGPFPEADVASAPIPTGTVEDSAGDDSGTGEDTGTGEEPTQAAALETPEGLSAALTAAGHANTIQELAIMQAWIPGVSSPQIAVGGGGTIEVYQLPDAASVEAALGAISGEGETAQTPPANATIWRAGNSIVILNEAPSNPEVEATLTALLGGPVTATIAGGMPPIDESADEGDGGAADDVASQTGAGESAGSGDPSGLPNTGSGGITDDAAGLPLIAWIGIGIAAAALAGALAVRRLLRDPR